MRVPSWGLSFGHDSHVYYLTLAWFVVSAWCMWAFTKTPLGRLALALRDNEHRVRFLGFNTHVARTLIFAISCMFTGVAGALLAIANEATNYTVFSAQASANVVLQTFIGGAGTFFGPALGAAIMTFFARVTSDLTRSWLLYQGLIFVLVMLFAPEGLGGLVSLHARKLRHGGWRHLVLPYLLCLVVGLLLIAGLVFVVESIHVVHDRRLLRQTRRRQGRLGTLSSCSAASFEPLSARHLGHSHRAARRRAAAADGARLTAAAWLVGHRATAGARSPPPRDGPQRAGRAGASRASSPAPHALSASPSWCSTPSRKSFGETQIIRGVDLDVKRGQRHALIGPNGAGKSTLFNLISGQYVPNSGEILLNGQSIAGLSPHVINRRGLSRSFQITNVFPRMSVAENLRISIMGRHGHRFTLFRPIRSLRSVNDEVDEFIEKLRLGATARRSRRRSRLLRAAHPRDGHGARHRPGGAAFWTSRRPACRARRRPTSSS